MINPKYFDVTYCSGPKLKFTKDITKEIYIEICEDLSATFAEKFGGEYIFEPESITEGGIILVQFPGKQNKMYKTMRHHLTSKNYERNVRWPWIDKKNVMEDWRDDSGILIPINTLSDTFLKAFHGAPTWTVDEIKLMCEVFTQYQIKCTRLPKKNELRSDSSGFL